MKISKTIIKEYLMLLIGCTMLAVCTTMLMVPNNIGSGGVTGIALCLNKLFGAKIGLSSILMNIPLFLFGYKLLGNKFTIRSVIAVIYSSLLMDNIGLIFTFKPMGDSLLASIFCGVLFGVGVAFIFISKGSTGGLDISAKIINNRFKSLQLSTLLMIQDIIVYVLVGIVMGPRSVMYAIIMSYVRSKTMDAIQEGLASSRQCIIICHKHEEIISALQSQLIRGVTILDAVGGFTNENKKFIYIVIQKNQLNALRMIVNKIEPEAFVTISPVNNIFGNFKNMALSLQE